ncbi:MAG: helix-turn-helix transcriptional regulator [Chloroflexota bacterium]|nr:helix-turn-helix transcriptional regulator [Chloroflexota bacterium]
MRTPWPPSTLMTVSESPTRWGVGGKKKKSTAESRPARRGRSPVVAYRQELGLTLQNLSSKTGLAVSYLSEIERGRKAGSTAAMKAIANALGTTIDVLLID